MGLTGPGLLVLVSALTAVLPILVVYLWRRSIRRGKTGGLVTAGRWLGVVACQLLAVALTFLLVNNSFTFYTSWADLFGISSQPVGIQDQGLVKAGQGSVQTLQVSGVRSGASGRVLIWLPPQYGDPAYAHTRFPVLMVLPGQPSRVDTMFRHFDFGAIAAAEINAGRVRPFVAVFPPLMINPPRDTECTNIAHGPQALTWLTSDVPKAVMTQLRTTPNPKQWGLMGWSTGAFCATKALLTAPARFSAAAGLGGYYEPIIDHTTGRLFGTSKILRDQNSPLHLYKTQGLAPEHSLLLVSGVQDRESYPMTAKMVSATTGNNNVYTLLFPQGGHNYRNYNRYLATILGWFNARGIFG